MNNVEIKTANGAQITPSDDAVLYNLMLGGKSGVIYGCNTSVSGTNLVIKKGYGVIHGRLFEVIAQSTHAVDEMIKLVDGCYYLICLKYADGILEFVAIEDNDEIEQAEIDKCIVDLNAKCLTVDDDYYMPIAVVKYSWTQGGLTECRSVYHTITSNASLISSFEELEELNETGYALDATLEKNLCLSFSNLSVSKSEGWSQDNIYSEYPYSAEVETMNVTDKYVPFVTFTYYPSGLDILAPFAVTSNNAVTVYAKEPCSLKLDVSCIRAF